MRDLPIATKAARSGLSSTVPPSLGRWRNLPRRKIRLPTALPLGDIMGHSQNFSRGQVEPTRTEPNAPDLAKSDAWFSSELSPTASTERTPDMRGSSMPARQICVCDWATYTRLWTSNAHDPAETGAQDARLPPFRLVPIAVEYVGTVHAARRPSRVSDDVGH